MTSFNPEEFTRYSRHLLLPEVGLEGQKKLKQARVLCIGLGGLGSPIAFYLAAAGVGCLGLVDDDQVDLSNLHRQILHGTPDCHHSKIESAQKKLHAINPHVELDLHKVRLTTKNAIAIAASYDLIVDGSDNFSTRYLVNDLSFFLKKPLVYGSIFRFEGHCTLFDTPQGGPCYRCLFPEPPPANSVPSCSEAGVLGVLPGIIGTLQATETLKWILNIGDSLKGRLLQVNALSMRFREFQLRHDPHCPLCGENPSLRELIDVNSISCSSTSMNPTKSTIPSVTVEELQQKLQGVTQPLLIDVREPFEYQMCHIPGAQLIPLGTLPAHFNAWDKETEIFLQCRSGGRSAEAVKLLQQAGFTKVFNVEGGILAWADRIDPTVQKY
ncbi:MAG: molybdopterin-synthase adenylyltransferase MoeB [Chthoniobacterales bacterium]|nr:molybdopterin-synthase adenylyltransferase MoeB [Chthoniobacterales bacterium]